MPALFDELELLERLTSGSSKGLFVDVGASIGRFSARFADLGWKVIAFEPEPGLAQEFRDRIGKESVRLHEIAVTDSDNKEAAFFLSPEHWGIHSLTPFHSSHTVEITVGTTRLDSAISRAEYQDPTILKIDVEGADLLALRSWDFAASRPIVALVEFMDSRSQSSYGYGHRDIIDFMESTGYSAYILEWTAINEYSRRGGSDEEAPSFIGSFTPPLQHEPAWGNIIFVDNDHLSWFETELVSYLSDVATRSRQLISRSERNEQHVRRMSETLKNRERRIRTLSGLVEQKHGRIAELDAAIIQRDTRIAELDAAIIQGDTRIAELDAAIIQRDTRIAELDAAIIQRDTRIAELKTPARPVRRRSTDGSPAGT